MRDKRARICETSYEDPRDTLQNRDEDPNNMNDALIELIEELREEANNTDRDLVGNTEYRIKHELANRLSDLIEHEYGGNNEIEIMNSSGRSISGRNNE